jgi:aspartyl-tRNA(Asn)/glutamyl-tRNA(Gln) amidotransferase subunit B
MEEDTGKLTHVGASGRINAALHALVDYNRSGVPLVEIVSEPDIRSSAQARAYASELRGILVATGASDGRMEEGSMRVDANVSVRPAGTEAFGTRCEIKNLNSLRSLGRAIEHEAARQIALRESGGKVTQETRHWDEASGRTDSMRSKEEANDYRYFPEPDLVPLAPDADWRARVRASLGPMPADRRSQLADALGGSPSDAEADQIRAVVDLGLDTLVTAAADAGAPTALALARAANEVAAQSEAGLRLDAPTFAALLAMESSGQLSATQSKAVLGALIERGSGDPAAVAAEMGFEALGADTLSGVLDEVIASHPDEWARFAEGEDKLMGMFTGEVMKATSGKANGKEVAAELRRRRG